MPGCSAVIGRRICQVGAGRFAGDARALWEIWPLAPVVDEVHEVVFVDGIHLGRKAVVLMLSPGISSWAGMWHAVRTRAPGKRS